MQDSWNVKPPYFLGSRGKWKKTTKKKQQKKNNFMSSAGVVISLNIASGI